MGMKIEFKNIAIKTEYRHLETGDFFFYEYHVHCKGDEDDRNGNTYSMRMFDGGLYALDNDELVVPINQPATLIFDGNPLN